MSSSMTSSNTALPLTVRHVRRDDTLAAVPRPLADALIARSAAKTKAKATAAAAAATEGLPTVLQLSWRRAPADDSHAPTDTDTDTQVSTFVAWAGDIVSATSTTSAAELAPMGVGSAPALRAPSTLTAASPAAPTIELDPRLATSLHLANGTRVTVRVAKSVPIASRVFLSPTSPDDWDILLLNAAVVERTLLKSLAIVLPGQSGIPLVLPSPINTTVYVTVQRIEPETTTCAYLVEGAEVAIEPKVRARDKRKKVPVPKLLRLVHASPSLSLQDADGVGVHQDDWGALTDHFDTEHTSALANIQVLVPPLVTPLLDNKQQQPPPSSHDSKQAQPPIRMQLLPSVHVTRGTLAVPQSSKASTAIAQSLARLHAIIPGAGIEYHGLGWTVKCIVPAVDSDTAGKPTHRIRRTSMQSNPENLSSTAPSPTPPTRALVPPHPIARLTSHVTHLNNYFTSATRSPALPFTIHGASGTGKSLLARAWLASLPATITPVYVALDTYLAPHASDRQSALLADLAASLAAVAPAALVLDALDAVVGQGEAAPEADGEDKPGTVARALVKHLDALVRGGRVQCVVCVRSADGVHRVLKEARWVVEDRGNNKTGQARGIALGEGGKEERQEILAALLASPHLNADLVTVDFDALAKHTDGYTGLDLSHIVARAHHLALAASSVELTQAHLQSALDTYTPATVAGLTQDDDSTDPRRAATLSSIGGLAAAKHALTSTLLYPTLYPDLFASLPLRPRQGLLLYGHPGCGKTHVLTTFARAHHLRLLAVKGPELLDKYIGASEAAVRNLFARARAAAPCVVFLDELDALAPRRGSDNAGVTDRVVNQLLTEMDGAEGLGKGVYVVGATSRPDLVDPALCRPGRLDKAVLCGLPDVDERKEILKAVASAVQMVDLADTDEDHVWEWVANRTDGFSGADLQAVVYNASLEGMGDIVKVDADGNILGAAEQASDEATGAAAVVHVQFKGGDTSVDPRTVAGYLGAEDEDAQSTGGDTAAIDMKSRAPKITLDHLKRALAATRPSVSSQLRNKLDRIYQVFSTGEVQVPTQQKLVLK